MNVELEGSGRGLIEVIFRHLNGEAEENYNDFIRDIGFHSRESKREIILAHSVKTFPPFI